MTTNVLLTGAGGQLAEEIKFGFGEKYQLHSFNHEELDITDPEALEAIIDQIKPDIIINTAAYTEVDRAESEPDKAFQVNASALKYLVDLAEKHDSRLLHFSTNYVFDGEQDEPYEPDDCPNPINTYGNSKLAGEHYVREYDRGVVVRTAGLYGGKPLKHDNFVNSMLELARKQDELRVVDDQIISPTWTRALVRSSERLIENYTRTIYHVAGRGQCGWFQFASKLVEYLSLDARVVPISSRELQRPANRPRHAALKSRCDGPDHQQKHWSNMLQEYCNQEHSEAERN